MTVTDLRYHLLTTPSLPSFFLSFFLLKHVIKVFVFLFFLPSTVPPMDCSSLTFSVYALDLDILSRMCDTDSCVASTMLVTGRVVHTVLCLDCSCLMFLWC